LTKWSARARNRDRRRAPARLRHLDVPADKRLLAVVDIPDGKHMVLLAGEALPLCQAGNRGMFMGTRPKGILGP
jgi:hypothetical protein